MCIQYHIMSALYDEKIYNSLIYQQVATAALQAVDIATIFSEGIRFKTTKYCHFIQQIQKELSQKTEMYDMLDKSLEDKEGTQVQMPQFQDQDDGGFQHDPNERELEKGEFLASTLMQDQKIYDQASPLFKWLEFKDDQSDNEDQAEQMPQIREEPKKEIDQIKLQPIPELQVGKAKQSQSTNRSQCKNFLPLIKKCFGRQFSKNPRAYVVALHFGFFTQRKSTSRNEIESFFKIPQMKQFFAQVFFSRSLKRELQNSRMNEDNRALFMSEISVLKKAFIKEKFTNL